MVEKLIADLNVVSAMPLRTPREIKDGLALHPEAVAHVRESRETLENIIMGKDPRVFLVLGPCSIHDLAAARDYAEKLKSLSAEVSDKFFVLMRVYFSKPRTTVGWRGFIHDPLMDGSFRMGQGLEKARVLLRDLAELGLPAATEVLDPITPQYIDDLITWSAIGARTTESQTHREMASGLSTPVGFKNGTDGNIDVAINALKTVAQGHHFLGINHDGQTAVIETRGNAFAHLVLRGGKRPNYDSVSVTLAETALKNAGLSSSLMVDCSHGNSMRQPELQPLVLKDCIQQILQGSRSIRGLMMESHLKSGQQSIPSDLSALEYGVSVTDACLGWEETKRAVLDAATALRASPLA